MITFTNSLRESILFGLFIGCLIGMNVLGGKIIQFGPFASSVAFLIVPLSFLITDIVSEVYGKAKAREWIFSGVITLFIFLLFILLFVALPPAVRYSQNPQYTTIFGTSARIVAASITAFLLSEYSDVWTFLFIRNKTHKKFLWLRTNLANSLSLLVDTFVFMYLAFYMLTPKFTALFVLQLAIPYLIFKIVWGMASSPLVYAGAKWLRGK